MTGANAAAGTDLERRLANLLARVELLEDELAVRRVLAAYGPAVDSGDGVATGRLWTESAVYDMDVGVLDGRGEIIAMVEGQDHQEIIGGGSAHAIGPALVDITGDHATAITYSQLFRTDGKGGFRIWRVAANRWDLARTREAESSDNWQIVRRTTRLLDGRPDARRLLRR